MTASPEYVAALALSAAARTPNDHKAAAEALLALITPGKVYAFTPPAVSMAQVHATLATLDGRTRR